MLSVFLATLQPLLSLILCIAIGFAVRKTDLLPHDAGKVMARLETWIFFPALNFITMARFCTVENVSTHARNILLGILCVSVSVGIAIMLGRIFVRTPCAERGIYTYALAFANGSYLGDPVVLALFGEEGLSYYKIFYLPFSIMIYTWGVKQLVPDENGKGLLKKILNAPMVAMLVGIAVGLTGLGRHLPSVFTVTLDSLKACLGPVAMLLAGFTIASYHPGELLKNGKVYVVALLRLFLLPAVAVAVLFGVKELINLTLHTSIDHSVLFFAFFATASALGLNTVVFPEAYGGNPKTGAAMAMISHTLCVISIPVMYALLVALFGPMTL